MESLSNIIIEKEPSEEFFDNVCKKQRFKGKYHEFGEFELKVDFELLKYSKKGKEVYEVNLLDVLDEDKEDFVKMNILNHV